MLVGPFERAGLCYGYIEFIENIWFTSHDTSLQYLYHTFSQKLSHMHKFRKTHAISV